MMTCPTCGERAKTLVEWFETLNCFSIRCRACHARLALTSASWFVVGLLFVGFAAGGYVAYVHLGRGAMLLALLGLGLACEAISYPLVRLEARGEDPGVEPSEPRDVASDVRPAVVLLAVMAALPALLGAASWLVTSSLEDLGSGVAQAVAFGFCARGLTRGSRVAWGVAVFLCALFALLLAALFYVYGDVVLSSEFVDGMEERGHSVWRVAMFAGTAVLGAVAFPTLMSRRVRGAIGR